MAAFLDIAITPSVRAAQATMGADQLWDDPRRRRVIDHAGAEEAAFIAASTSFYIATVSETGWPYVQHRGGPPGFLHVLDPKTLAFADYRGNRQYISLGNLAANPRAALFLMDYPRRARLKIYATVEATALDADPALTQRLLDPGYRARPERLFTLHLEALDWNCSQHITPRFTEAEIAAGLRPLRERLAELEAENAQLHAQLRTRLADPAPVTNP